jgi:cation transport ATPase
MATPAFFLTAQVSDNVDDLCRNFATDQKNGIQSSTIPARQEAFPPRAGPDPARASVRTLWEMAMASMRVVRDGAEHVIKANDVVVGDVVLLGSDSSPAFSDLIIIEGECEVDRSATTGESTPVPVRVGEYLQEGDVIVSEGSSVRAVAVAVGDATRLSQVFVLLSAHTGNSKFPTQEQYDLTVRLSQLHDCTFIVPPFDERKCRLLQIKEVIVAIDNLVATHLDKDTGNPSFVEMTPKDGVEQAVRDLAVLGVSVRLVSGIQEEVLVRAAKSVGIWKDASISKSGLDLKSITPADLINVSVVGGACPEHIYMFTDLLGQGKPSAIAFVGNNVDDTPPMKRAGMSFASRHRATPAATRSAADCLVPDNISPLVTIAALIKSAHELDADSAGGCQCVLQ